MISRMGQALSALLLGFTLTGVPMFKAVAAPPETAPAELTDALEQIQTAANAQNLDGVIRFYGPDFTNTDGFDREQFSQALIQLWQQYPQLTYRLELQSWEQSGGMLSAETITYLEGTGINGGRTLTLEAMVRSRQQFESGQIVSQEVLSERNQVTSGENPPEVTVVLPEETSVGAAFDFDAIVREPLGERLLLGAAVDEGITAEDFFVGRPLTLELLAAGGLFKIGTAPDQPDNRWISAVLIHEEGTTIVSQRLRVR
ncbi:MAG: nuclear transport factor 2 family protein [Leptolyngbyaceae cyanobacterium SM1_1_3]|nr:nuclear transport factor 2 family protein [Leptolyngbyaceae cyanobacterium SM1_1_3]NJN01694.1 nuclear transport factor 2 family protein [Leptolyngbyaceae cyanobacterium RM1_1_2]NJO11319.1 nuclear transport factor 2 family protein [Leptolyngbyaceae cyanobacterium SL_1_1]